MLGIIGKKIGMTSVFQDGKNLACTLIGVDPCVVTQIKNKEGDGYNAVQLGFGEKKEKNTSAALIGHFKKSSTSPKHKLLEFRDYEKEVELGQEIKVADIFEEGEYVDVQGKSKGKGFQGVVKRHGFKGVGDMTHGQHNRQRHPGSIGACSYPARVFKGMKMAGRMGNDNLKIINLKVIKIYSEKNLLLLSGAVPGHKNSYVIITK